MDTAFLARLTGAARTTVRTIEDRTPAHRDRALDGLRALALLAVPVGHWLLERLHPRRRRRRCTTPAC